MFESTLYKSLPRRGQECVIGVRGMMRRMLRETSAFDEALNQARRTQWLSQPDLEAWQQRQLRAVVDLAAAEVPHYRELFTGLGIDPHGGAASERWQELPLLTKPTVAAAFRRFVADGASLRLTARTSGTTGTPLTIVQDLAAVRREHAYVVRQLEWAGIAARDRRAWFRADLVAPVDQKEPPFWRYNWGEGMLMFSSFHLKEATCAAYLERLQGYDPHVIHAYPSSIGYLAKYLEAKGAAFGGRSLKAIITSSEVLGKEQRQLIEQRFGVRVYDWYGSVERVAAIGTCEHGSYHLLSDYGFSELIDLDGRRAELVATGFVNRVMPLIRYRTGDVVVRAPADARCPCGRAMPLIERIEGRNDDFLLTADGRQVYALNHILRGADSILEAQIVQEEIGRLRVLAVPYRRLASADRARVVDAVHQHLGAEVKVEVEPVKEIPRGPNGKFKAVVNRVTP